MASSTLQKIRSVFAQSTGPDYNGTDAIIISRDQKDYLGLIDIETFAKLQSISTGAVGNSSFLGSTFSMGTLFLGEGGSFAVRREPSSAYPQYLTIWDKDFDKSKRFVVVKQPSVRDGEDDFDKRLYDVMMELKVSAHTPLRMHPNIIHLHSLIWDVQSNDANALAPSLILEYADLGTVSDFQDSNRLILHSDTKLQICLDVAEGLSFLNKCGIVHGDVKSEYALPMYAGLDFDFSRNIFLFRDKIHEKRQVTAIRAKIGDFGSVLIGVFEDPSCPKQRFRGYSPPWDAPEQSQEMDASSLRRMDMYSYGLTVWRIMCNGKMPYHKLFWDSTHENVFPESKTTPARPLNRAEFLALKKEGNKLLSLAIGTLKNRPESDVDSSKIQMILEVTLCFDPTSRATNFDEIVKILCTTSSKKGLVPNPKPEPLKPGDFGIMDPRFPSFLYKIRSSPASFRSLICEQLTKKAQSSETKSKCALYHLALGVCHWQRFCSCANQLGMSSAPDPDCMNAGAKEIWESAGLGNPIAQSIAPKALDVLELETQISQIELEEWLVNSMRHGSIRAKNEMKKRYSTKFTAAVLTIRETRRKAATLLSSDKICPYAAEFFENIPGLDPAAKATLCYPGVSRLHQAAYLGAILICQELVENFNFSIDTVNVQNETPLHYAIRNSQLAVAQYLLDKGANINAQREYGTGVLHMAFCSYDTESTLTFLLERGANPDVVSLSTLEQLPDQSDYFIIGGGTPLHLSIRCENLEAAFILLKHGANPNYEVEGIGSPLRVGLQMHSMPLLEFLMPWVVKNVENLPIVHDLYSSLVGFYAEPMYRYMYWEEKKSLKFVLSAMQLIRKYGLGIDERVLLSWALDAGDIELTSHLLDKLFNTDKFVPMNFRDYRGSDTSEWRTSVDFLSPNLKNILSVILVTSSKEMIRTVLSHIREPLGSFDDTGTPFLVHLACRQIEPREDLSQIVSWLIQAGANLKTAGSLGKGPLQTAASWNNSNLADILLDYEPSFEDVQHTMQACAAKSNSLIADKIMRSIFQKFPQVLTTSLPKQNLDILQLVMEYHDPNYLRTICSRPEFGQPKNLQAGMLKEVIQYMKGNAGGDVAVKELLADFGNLFMTPLHCAANNGNVEAVQILLEEGADINAFSANQEKDADNDLSVFTCLADLTSLDDEQEKSPLKMSCLTPLDLAYSRDWGVSLAQWPQPVRSTLMEIRLAGGANKEEAEYEARTQTTIDLLRANGAKTFTEIFALPNITNSERSAQFRKSRKEHLEEAAQKRPSDTHERIHRFWGNACVLHSAIVTQYEYPHLLTQTDPTRPRYSEIFTDCVSQFDRILSIKSELLDKELQAAVESDMSRYSAWAEKNHLREGELDEIADIPGPSLSIILSASIFTTLREINFTLRYIEEALTDPQPALDQRNRCKDLSKDLSTAINILTSEEKTFKVLSDLAVAEIEEMHHEIRNVRLDGNPKSSSE